MKILFLLLIFLPCLVFSCEKEVPIDVKWMNGKIPTKDKVGYLMIFAPVKYEGLSLGGVQLESEKNRFSLMKYVSESKYPGKALFEATTTLEFVSGAKFSVHYTPDPVVHEDGRVTVMPCLHVQEIEVKI